MGNLADPRLAGFLVFSCLPKYEPFFPSFGRVGRAPARLQFAIVPSPFAHM